MNPLVRHERVGSRDSSHRLRIAHLSDLHVWFGERKFRAIERCLASWRPDVLALTGDYADTPWGRRIAAEWMRRMASSHPLCWIAGNHDRWGGRSFVRELEALPHAHAIDRADAWITAASGGRFRFTSIERQHAADGARAPGEASVVLLHNPAAIAAEQLRDAQNCLLLAGHLHGGQINLWRDRRGRPQPGAWCYRWLFERTRIGGAELIVSRGLGDTFPLRLRAPREIVMVDFAV